MLYLRFIVVLLVITSLVSCSASEEKFSRATSAATTAQDVVDAWDLHCATWNFMECPPNVLDPDLCTVTIGDMHNAVDFTADCDGLMQAMQDELDSGRAVDPGDGHEIDSVIMDEAWLQ